TGILQLESARQRAQKGSLTEAGNALQKHMSPSQQTDQNALDDIVLPNDDFSDFAAYCIEAVYRQLERGFRSHHLHCRAGEMPCPCLKYRDGCSRSSLMCRSALAELAGQDTDHISHFLQGVTRLLRSSGTRTSVPPLHDTVIHYEKLAFEG